MFRGVVLALFVGWCPQLLHVGNCIHQPIYMCIKAKQSMHKRNSEKFVNIVVLKVLPLFPKESLFINCPM